VAVVVCGIPASIRQHRYSPILKDAHAHTHVDWRHIFIVGLILSFAVVTSVVLNLRFPAFADRFPFIGAASWPATLGLGFLSAVFDNIPLTALALKQGGYDWGMLAYAAGCGVFLAVVGWHPEQLLG
jgi:hypothetical protein